MKKIICLILYSFAILSANAMYPIVYNFTRDDYHAASKNWDFTQNDGGCAYFANNDGLLEFDGINWSLYPIKNYTSVRSIFYDSQSKRIYAGASYEFGYYEYTSLGTLEYTSLVDPKDVDVDNIGEIWHIYRDKETIYFQGDYNIYRYTAGSPIKTIHFNDKIEYSTFIKGSLIISVQGESPIIQSGELQVKLTHSEILADKKVSSILLYQEDKILFVTESDGIFVHEKDQLKPFVTDIDSFLQKSRIFSATTDGQTLALGTILKGLVIIKPDGKIMYSNANSGMQNNTVLNLKYDKDHNLWMCLDKGIDYAITNSPETSLLGARNIIGAGYASIHYDDKLYLGTNQGLYYLHNHQMKGLTQYSPTLIEGLQGQVWKLREIDNTLFCAHNNGLYLIKKGKTRRIKELNGVWDIVHLKKHPQYILGCSYTGLFLLKKVGDEWRYSHHLENFNEVSRQFAEDEFGSIWFRQWMKGLYKLTLNQTGDSIAKQEYFGNNHGFPSNSQNIPYHWNDELVFSSEAGYYQYNEKENEALPYLPLNKLFEGPRFATSIHQSPNKDTFFISGDYFAIATYNEDGTYTMDSVSLRYMKNKLINGFEDVYFANKDTAIISTEDGFSLIDISKTRYGENKNSNHQVFINSIYSTNHKESLLYGQRENIALDQEFILSYANNSLKFDYTSPQFKGKSDIEYSCLLENYDSEWSQYSTAHIKEYTKLTEGSYRFRVKAKNTSDGQIANHEFPFKILPPWYRTVWAYIAYGLIFIVLIFISIHLIRKYYNKNLIKLKQEKEREIKKQKDEFEHQTLEHELRHKAQELANSTLNLARKNEILIKIKEELGALETNIKGSAKTGKVQKQITAITKEINQNVGNDSDWFRFEENFDLVYEDFLKRLSKTYPQLNTNNKRLCAYIKMSLSSKDIASLLNISVKSVEMARHRLRQKMELDSSVNLAEYLRNF